MPGEPYWSEQPSRIFGYSQVIPGLHALLNNVHCHRFTQIKSAPIEMTTRDLWLLLRMRRTSSPEVVFCTLGEGDYWGRNRRVSFFHSTALCTSDGLRFTDQEGLVTTTTSVHHIIDSRVFSQTLARSRSYVYTIKQACFAHKSVSFVLPFVGTRLNFLVSFLKFLKNTCMNVSRNCLLIVQ